MDRAAAEVLAGRICAGASEQAKATCQLLELIGEFDRGSGWSWMTGVKSLAHWLSWSCSMASGTAREHVRVARAMALLPTVTAAFRRGELSYSKVREISRVAGVVDEARLLSMARNSTASQLARSIASFRTAAGLRIREEDRRRFSLASREGGEYTGVSGRLPNDEAAIVEAALHRARDLNGQPQPSPSPDERDGTPAYTSADALRDICQHYLNTAVTDDQSGEDRSLVVIEIAAEQLLTLPDVAETVATGSTDVPAGTATHSRADIPAEAVPVSAAVPAGADVPAAADLLASTGVPAAADVPADSDVPAGAVPAAAGVPAEADVPAGSVSTSQPVSATVLGPEVCTVRGRGPTEPETARRHLCTGTVLGAIIDRQGEVLALGRSRRLVTRRQRRALMVRDRMCQFPGCHQTRHLDAHHRVSWAAGGATDLENLILLCRFHHTTVHEGGISIDRSAAPADPRTQPPTSRWRFAMPDGTLIADHGWQTPTAERLTRELRYQLHPVGHIDSFDHGDARTIRAVGGGVGFELRSCVDALFGMIIEDDSGGGNRIAA